MNFQSFLAIRLLNQVFWTLFSHCMRLILLIHNVRFSYNVNLRGGRYKVKLGIIDAVAFCIKTVDLGLKIRRIKVPAILWKLSCRLSVLSDISLVFLRSCILHTLEIIELLCNRRRVVTWSIFLANPDSV